MTHTLVEDMELVSVTTQGDDDFLKRVLKGINKIGQESLWSGPWDTSNANGLVFPPEDPLRGIEETPRSSVVSVATLEDSILGYVIIRMGTGLMSYSQGMRERFGHLGQFGFVRSSAVAKDHRGNHILEQLFPHALAEASMHGVEVVAMHVREAPVPNNAAQHAVARAGFLRTDYTQLATVPISLFGLGASQQTPADNVKVEYRGYIRAVPGFQIDRSGDVPIPEECNQQPLAPEGLKLIPS